MRSGCVRLLSVFLLPALVVVLGGCLGGGHALGTPGSIPVGQSSQTIEFGGTRRTFNVHRPQGLPDTAPLVVMLHGGFGTGAQAERSYHWDNEADAGHFLVAYPDGLNRAWNAGTCCGEPQRVNADDVGFITAMVGAIEQQIPVDRARVYATGMSNGAMMALRLGCQTDTFAAIAPVAGTLLTDCSGARPTSLLQIHGTADDRVPYNGGPGKALAANGTPRVDGRVAHPLDHPFEGPLCATTGLRPVRGTVSDHHTISAEKFTLATSIDRSGQHIVDPRRHVDRRRECAVGCTDRPAKLAPTR
jgi:polyhydroxybutyrate depolymerase